MRIACTWLFKIVKLVGEMVEEEKSKIDYVNNSFRCHRIRQYVALSLTP